jgi:hypothetical protein
MSPACRGRPGPYQAVDEPSTARSVRRRRRGRRSVARSPAKAGRAHHPGFALTSSSKDGGRARGRVRRPTRAARRRRLVGGVRREVEEERPPLPGRRRGHEGHNAGGEDVGLVLLGLLPGGLDVAVVVRAEVQVRLRVENAEPVVPARGHIPRVAGGIPVQVLADEGGAAARGAQPRGSMAASCPAPNLLKPPRAASCRRAVAVAVLAREDRGPRGCTPNR